MCFKEFSKEKSEKIFSILKKINKEHKLPKSSSINLSKKPRGFGECERCVLSIYGKQFKTNVTTCLYIIKCLDSNGFVIPWNGCLGARTLSYELLEYFESNSRRNIKI